MFDAHTSQAPDRRISGAVKARAVEARTVEARAIEAMATEMEKKASLGKDGEDAGQDGGEACG